MAQMLEYKCPCCGGKIEFDSGTQKMKCPYCDTEFDLETLKGYDEVLREEAPEETPHWQTDSAEWNGQDAANMAIFTCKSCGGELVADENTAATSCPFCGSPVVLTGRLSGDLKPDYVIPFKLDKKAAKEALKRHLQGKRLLPKQFQDENHLDEIKGVYVPYWLFDADASANIRYRATRVRHWSDSNYNYTETSYYSLLRAGNVSFDHVPVDGSSKMPDDMMESIEPFDFSEAVDFQTAYLSGYLADRYDVNSESSIQRANERVRRSTEEVFAATAQGYSSVMPENTNIRLNNGKAHYALYPVWLLNSTWNGKQYTFAMNGQTGKFVGDLPLDKKAYWRWWAILAGISTAAVYLLMTLVNIIGG